MGWSKVQDGFTHISGTLVGRARRLSSAGTVSWSTSLWPFQHGGLRGVGLHTGWLMALGGRIPVNKVEVVQCFMAPPHFYSIILIGTVIGFKERGQRPYLSVGSV